MSFYGHITWWQIFTQHTPIKERKNRVYKFRRKTPLPWIKSSRETGRDLAQSYDKSPYTHRKIQKATCQHKISITQRLLTYLGRSVGVTIATQLVWLNQLRGSQRSHSPQQLCNRGHKHAGIILQLAEIYICIVYNENDIALLERTAKDV